MCDVVIPDLRQYALELLDADCDLTVDDIMQTPPAGPFDPAEYPDYLDGETVDGCGINDMGYESRIYRIDVGFKATDCLDQMSDEFRCTNLLYVIDNIRPVITCPENETID